MNTLFKTTFITIILSVLSSAPLNGAEALRGIVARGLDGIRDLAGQEAANAAARGLAQPVEELTRGFVEAATEDQKRERRRKDAALNLAQERAQATIRVAENNAATKTKTEQYKELMHTFVETFFDDKQRLARVAGATVAVAGGVYFFKNGMPIVRKMVENYLFTPSLIDETSVRGRFLGLFSKAKQENGLQELHYDEELQAQVTHIVDSYERTSEQHTYFSNYLFYGEPGTGKTATARSIALKSGLDYAIMSGGNIQKLLKSGKAEEKLKEVFKWAQSSKNGLILFIDEADAFLKDPNKYEMSEELYAVLNSFLNLTGTESKKISLIMATNHPNQLPKAVIDRVGPGQFVYFGLPNYEQRRGIVSQFIAKYFPKNKCAAFTQEIIDEMACKFDGFSGRNISYALLSLSHQPLFTGTTLDTVKLSGFVDRAVEQSKLKNSFHTFA